ncbi:MAG: pectinesterase family protein, partial [Chloroflexota bacterium]
MNTNKELDQIVHDWLEDRVAEPQPDGLNRALERLDATPQNRRRFLGWWFHKPPDHHSRRNRLMFSATGIIGAIAVLALAANLASSPSQDQAPAAGAGATHIVAADGSGDFSTIGEAVDAAAEGDTILVKPGTYTEAIVIDKDITISGDGPREDIIVEAQQESSLLPDCVPVPFTDTNGCVFVLDQTDTTISGLTFRGDWAGIDIIGGEPTIQGVVFDHVGSPFRSGLPGKGIPIALTEASRAHIIESEFINSADFGIFGLSSPTVEDNIFSGGT